MYVLYVHPACLSDYTTPTHYVKYPDSTIIVFEIMHLFARLRGCPIPLKAGLIEYWLEELLVAASKEGEEGGKGKSQQQQVKFVFLNSHP